MATNQDIYIPLTKIVDNYGLINHTPEINTDEIKLIFGSKQTGATACRLL